MNPMWKWEKVKGKNTANHGMQGKKNKDGEEGRERERWFQVVAREEGEEEKAEEMRWPGRKGKALLSWFGGHWRHPVSAFLGLWLQ